MADYFKKQLGIPTEAEIDAALKRQFAKFILNVRFGKLGHSVAIPEGKQCSHN